MFPGDVAYIWHAGIPLPGRSSGKHCHQEQARKIRSQIIWVKPHIVLSARRLSFWSRAVLLRNPSGKDVALARRDRKQSTVWKVANLNPFGGDRTELPTGHGTQKPVELVRRAILNHLERGEALYDGFLGS